MFLWLGYNLLILRGYVVHNPMVKLELFRVLVVKKPKPSDTFLYQHFQHTGHSPNDVLVQPVEK